MHPGVCSSPTARAGKVLWNESSQDSHAGDTEQEENGEMGPLATCKEAARARRTAQSDEPGLGPLLIMDWLLHAVLLNLFRSQFSDL